MKLSERLQVCADLVRPGGCAADIGTDHGFLAIWLVQNHVCAEVIAADLREKPLETARKNARAAGAAEHISFCISDGLQSIPVERVDTVICAGMGGDLITGILEAAAAAWTPDRQFILQPQSAAADLRAWLIRHGFEILEERFASDAGFIYTVLDVRYRGPNAVREPSPAECVLPQGDTRRGSALYRRYLCRTLENVAKTVDGLQRAREQDTEKLAYFRAALTALQLREKEDLAYDENSQ